jgi:hypothetical protein
MLLALKRHDIDLTLDWRKPEAVAWYTANVVGLHTAADPNFDGVCVGLSRIVASHHRRSTLCQIHEHIRCLCI